MRYLTPTLILAAGLLAVPAMAEPPKDGGGKGDRPGREEMREKMLKEHDKDGDGKLSDEERKAAHDARHEKVVKEFDKDGDGKLSDEERRNARESMRDRWGGGRKDGKDGKAKKPGDKKGKKGPGDGRGPRGPGGPMGPPLPSPDEMFKKFDADKNDSLSREEFNKLAEFVKKHHPHGPPPGGPDGRPGFRRGQDGRGPGGPPRGEGRGPRNGERRRGDREGRPDGPPRDGEGAKEAAGDAKESI